MEIIRETALFTALLHCVLAYSLSSNNLPQTAEPYDTISHSFVNDILEKPSFHKEPQTKATDSFVSSSDRNDKMTFDVKTDNYSLGDIMKSIKQLFQPELPRTTPKEIKSKYPLTTPRVEIGLSGSSGMLPVKIHNSHSDKPEPAKILASTNTDKPTKPMNAVFEDKGDFLKRPLSYNPIEYAKEEIMPLDYSTTPTSQYGLKFSQNHFHATPSDKPDLSGVFLNLLNYHQTNPGIDVRKDQIDKPFQYTPSYSVLPGLVPLPYPTLSGVRGNSEHTSTFKPDHASDATKPAIVGNLPMNPDLYGENVQPRAYQYTPYRYVPEIESHSVSKEHNDGHIQSTAPYKESPALNISEPPIDYSPTKPIGEEVVLPPVPTSLSLLQRVQIALLNTVSGLPGGVGGALEALAARAP